jgi:antitoxin (DNA-binding transcriptional repressor) of toxin-antitoxin stability system
MEQVSIDNGSVDLLALAKRVQQGETIVLVRDGIPVANIVPHRPGGIDWEGGRRYLRERGIERLVTYIAPDFDDPLPEDFLLQPLPDPTSDEPPEKT